MIRRINTLRFWVSSHHTCFVNVIAFSFIFNEKDDISIHPSIFNASLFLMSGFEGGRFFFLFNGNCLTLMNGIKAFYYFNLCFGYIKSKIPWFATLVWPIWNTRKRSHCVVQRTLSHCRLSQKLASCSGRWHAAWCHYLDLPLSLLRVWSHVWSIKWHTCLQCLISC